MKLDIKQFIGAIENFNWNVEELATNLSAIGHEADAINEGVEVSLTANRKDCQEFDYLIFDLCALYPELKPIKTISFSHQSPINVSIERINQILGTSLSIADLTKLERLGFIVDTEQSTVQAPDFRTGINTNADIAEEILRVVGFANIPISNLNEQPAVSSDRYQKLLSLKRLLVNAGMFETVTYSFASSGKVELKNPHSTQEPYLRTSLLEGLLKTAAKNPFLKKLTCFEISSIFNPEEQLVVGVLATNLKNLEAMSQENSEILGTRVEFKLVEQNQLDQLNIKQNKVYFFEIPFDNVSIKAISEDTKLELAKFKPISKFPPLTRDITLPITEPEALTVVNNLSRQFKELLFGEIIDSYENPETKKESTTIRLFLQKMNSSFTESEILAIDSRMSDFLKTD